MQQIFVIFLSFLLVLAYGQTQGPEPAPIRGPQPFIQFQPKAPESNPIPQPARAPETTNPVPQPQVKVPSTNPVPQPQVKVPSTNPVPQPQVKVPSTNPVPQPQVKTPESKPSPQPQVKVPESPNPVPQPQVKAPESKPSPQPQVKVPESPKPQPDTIILVPVPHPLKEQPASPNPVPQSPNPVPQTGDGSSDKCKEEEKKIRDNAVQIKVDIDQSLSSDEATTTIPTTILYLDQITVKINVTLGSNGTQNITLKKICDTWRTSLTKSCGRVFNDCTWIPTTTKRQATGDFQGSTVSPAPTTTPGDGSSGSLLFSILSSILFVGIGFLL